MKRLVLERDGLDKGCYWCAQPFAVIFDATLEHIKPLFDGGEHSLENCGMACRSCNLDNEPVNLRKLREDFLERRMKNADANRKKNGYKLLVSPPQIEARFHAVRSSVRGKFLDSGHAAPILRRLHQQVGLPPPDKKERKAFQSHFNRWNNLANQNRISQVSTPAGYINPFQPQAT